MNPALSFPSFSVYIASEGSTGERVFPAQPMHDVRHDGQLNEHQRQRPPSTGARLPHHPTGGPDDRQRDLAADRAAGVRQWLAYALRHHPTPDSQRRPVRHAAPRLRSRILLHPATIVSIGPSAP